MSYYKVFGLDKEPFSTSPDPEFFFRSESHDKALKRIEIAIRLRRGLSLILGDVGTGKTTLSRTLLQILKNENDFIFHMILDPAYKTEHQFFSGLAKIFGLNIETKSAGGLKEALERYLFQKGVSENKTIVLLIDEGQKLSSDNLEVLRTLLNYETNEYKLLQLVIMAQAELLPRVKKINNFLDRIALKYTINPVDEAETKELIIFRLKQAGFNNKQSLFTDEAIKIIYQQTQGYPRRIAMICHDALEALIMRGRNIVDEEIIRGLILQGKIYER